MNKLLLLGIKNGKDYWGFFDDLEEIDQAIKEEGILMSYILTIRDTIKESK